MIDMSQTRGSTYGVTVAAAATEVVSGSEKRIALIFTGPNAGRITLGNSNAITLDNGHTISLTSGPLELTFERHGNLVKMPWWAIASAGGTLMGVSEVLSG